MTQVDIYPIPGFTQPVSSLTHLLGAGVFAILGLLLVRRGWGNPVRVTCLGVYVFSCVLLMSMSGVYHLLPFGTTGRAVLERLDHDAIFVLIAGTFTPVHGILFRGPARWGMLLLVWLAAVAGISLKTIFFERFPEGLGLLLYLVLAWIGALSAVTLWRRHGLRFVLPVIGGAVCYTGGALQDFLRCGALVPGIIGSHEIFHLAVLAGAGFHWKFISQFASGEVIVPAPALEKPDPDECTDQLFLT